MNHPSDNHDRPKIDARQQVEKLRDKGVAFNLYPEKEAERFLRDRNFYFKLKAFEKVFDKYENTSHPKHGQYINLDFAYLVELSRLDKSLRFFIMEATLDIEHFMKVRLNRAMMDDPTCDSHEIIRDYFAYDTRSKLYRLAQQKNSNALRNAMHRLNNLLCNAIRVLSDDEIDLDRDMDGRLAAVEALDSVRDAIESELDGLDLHHIEKSITRLATSQYSGRLARKYGQPDKMAYWHFFELATFGDIIGLYKYYFIERGKSKDEVAKRLKPLLFPVRTLRNAGAHNSCLLNTSRDRLKRPVGAIAKALTTSYEMELELVTQTKRIPLVHDFSAMLLCYDSLVTSPHSRDLCSRRLRELSARILRHEHFFSNQSEVLHCLQMLAQLAERFAVQFAAS